MVGGFALISLGPETPETVEVSGTDTGKKNKHHCVTKRAGSHERNLLEVDNRTRGIKE